MYCIRRNTRSLLKILRGKKLGVRVPKLKALKVTQKPTSVVSGRSIGLEEPLIPFSALVRYLHHPGELEGGRRRATDPVWSLTTHTEE